MIELTVLNYLKSVLSVPVLMEKPTKERFTDYIVIEKTGGGRENHINTAIIVIQSYSDSLYEAAALNENVKKAMIGDGKDSFGIVGVTDVSRCELNGDYNYTDTSTKSYRYQAVYDLVF